MNNVKKVLLLAAYLSSNVLADGCSDACYDSNKFYNQYTVRIVNKPSEKWRFRLNLGFESYVIKEGLLFLAGNLIVIPDRRFKKINGVEMVEVNAGSVVGGQWTDSGIHIKGVPSSPFPKHLPTSFFEGKKEGDIIFIMFNNIVVKLQLAQMQNDTFYPIKGCFEDRFNDIKKRSKN